MTMKNRAVRAILLAGAVIAVSKSAMAEMSTEADYEVDSVSPILSAQCSSDHLHAFIQRRFPMLIPIWAQDEPVKCEADGSFSANGKRLTTAQVTQLLQDALDKSTVAPHTR